MLFWLHCSDFEVMYLISCWKLHILFFSTTYLNVIWVIYNLANTVKLLKGYFTQTLSPCGMQIIWFYVFNFWDVSIEISASILIKMYISIVQH